MVLESNKKNKQVKKVQTQQTFRNIFFVIGAMFIVMAVVKFSIAIGTEPLGPESITNRFSSRMTNSSFGAKWVTGAAGNVTGLTINATSPTRAWQGYFGNISGQLVLMDSDNWTFYDWYESEPEGEIYATHNSSVVWANIRCFNFTSDDGDAERGWIATNINATTENNRTGTPNHAADAINVTFSTSKNHTGFSVGTVLFNDSWCPTTYTYIDNQSQSLEFVEVLLTDGAASAGG